MRNTLKNITLLLKNFILNNLVRRIQNRRTDGGINRKVSTINSALNVLTKMKEQRKSRELKSILYSVKYDAREDARFGE